MVKKKSSITVLLIVLGLITSCGSSSSKEVKDIMLDMDDNNSQIELAKGQILVISLEAQPSTGYTWEVAELNELILQQQGEPEFQPTSDGIGASGVLIFRFEAISTGETNLKLIYHQPWVEDVEPIETFFIQVIVY
jgi:inhibitor of cysteine peptidase